MCGTGRGPQAAWDHQPVRAIGTATGSQLQAPAAAHVGLVQDLSAHGKGCIDLLLRNAVTCSTMDRAASTGSLQRQWISGEQAKLESWKQALLAGGTAAANCRRRDASVPANTAKPPASCWSQSPPTAPLAHLSGRRTLQGRSRQAPWLQQAGVGSAEPHRPIGACKHPRTDVTGCGGQLRSNFRVQPLLIVVQADGHNGARHGGWLGVGAQLETTAGTARRGKEDSSCCPYHLHARDYKPFCCVHQQKLHPSVICTSRSYAGPCSCKGCCPSAPHLRPAGSCIIAAAAAAAASAGAARLAGVRSPVSSDQLAQYRRSILRRLRTLCRQCQH